MKKKKKMRLCGYCGKDFGIEDDHVPPKAFFPKPKPTNDKFVIVPACSNCNRGSWIDGGSRMSKDEEYMRSVIIVEWNAGNHPAAIRLLENEVVRAMTD